MAKGWKDMVCAARERIREIDTTEAAEILARRDRTLFLDVREPDEFVDGHLPRAVLLPRGILEPRAAADSPARDPDLADPDRPIIVYCASGGRSTLAAATLQELGFTDVRSLAGGIQAWERESRPLVD